jgi:glycine/D-amino acid oxidase-like deaminating enzyme
VTKYGRSPWPERTAKSRIPTYPRLRGPVQADVAIIGGGLTGCATAYALTTAGIKVALVEAKTIGRGSTEREAGWVADDPGVGFGEIENALGRRAARHVFQAWRRAALDAGALVRRLSLKCDFESRGTLIAAFTIEQAAALKKEQKARKGAGLDAPLVNARAIASDVAAGGIAALRSRDGATLDPFRAVLGLARAAEERGARLFEQSSARRVKFGRRSVDVMTRDGSIRAGRVVVATGVPTALFAALQRHFWFNSAFLVLTDRVPAKIRNQLGGRVMVLRDMAAPPHIIRWVDGDQLLVGGADAATPPDRQLDRVLVQRTGQLMYELSTIYPDISGIQPAYGWDATYGKTADGLPFIGPHRNFPHHLFAFGDSSRSVTGAFLASRILLRHVLDDADAADEAFGFNRYGHVR